MIPKWFSTKVVQTVPGGCISRSWGQKIGFQCNFQKSSCLKLHSPELSYLIYNIINRSSTEVVQTATEVKIESQFYIELYKENFK